MKMELKNFSDTFSSMDSSMEARSKLNMNAVTANAVTYTFLSFFILIRET